MKSPKLAISICGFAALIIIGLGAIRDETGTIQYRNGATQTYDTSISIADEDGAWSLNNAKLSALSTIATSPSIQTFPSASNAVTVAVGGATYLLVSATPIA